MKERKRKQEKEGEEMWTKFRDKGIYSLANKGRIQ